MSDLNSILLQSITEACSSRKQPPQVANRIKAWIESAAAGLSAEEKQQRLGDIRDVIKVQEEQ